jgi:TonB family protein
MSDDGVTPPRVTKSPKANYRPAAMRARVQGGVKMEAIVETDGTVGDIRVVHSLDKEFGMDDEAIETLKQWRFEPGKKDGEAVPVLVAVEMTFTIRK